jgi:hypothetical protein
MDSKYLSRVSGWLILTILFLAFSFNSVAQEEAKPQKDNTQTQDQQTQDQMSGDEEKFKQTADELTQSLSQNVNLTEDQRTQINEVLVEYQKDVAEIDPQAEEMDRTGKINNLQTEIRNEIEDVFDENQLTAYQESRDQWWRDVQTRIHPQIVIEDQETDQQY